MEKVSNGTYSIINRSFYCLDIRTNQTYLEEAPLQFTNQGITLKLNQPYFSAHSNQYWRANAPKASVIFNVVGKNIGGGYEPGSSTFKAPVKGIYLFKAGAKVRSIPDSVSSYKFKLITGNQTSEEVYVINKSKNRIFDFEIVEAAFMKMGEIAKVVLESEFPVDFLQMDHIAKTSSTYFQGSFIG